MELVSVLLLGLLVGLALGVSGAWLVARSRVEDTACGHEDPTVLEALHAAGHDHDHDHEHGHH